MSAPRLTNQRTSTPPARKLAFAVFGATAQVPLHVIHDTLELKILAAQSLGYRDAADSLACARRRVAAVCGQPDSPVSLNTQLKDPDFDEELEAALREVHAAYAHVPRSYIGALVPSTARPPDPDLAEDRLSLARELRILLGWTGTSTYSLAAYARHQGSGIAQTDLRGVLVFGNLPEPAELDVILTGSGIPPEDHAPWHRARERAVLGARQALGPPTGPAADIGQAERPVSSAGSQLPDPGAVHTASALRQALGALAATTGHDAARLQQQADAEGLHAPRGHLDGLMRRRPVALPEPLLRAFLAGCGLDPTARGPWLLAYQRVYTNGTRKAQANARRWAKAADRAAAVEIHGPDASGPSRETAEEQPAPTPPAPLTPAVPHEPVSAPRATPVVIPRPRIGQSAPKRRTANAAAISDSPPHATPDQDAAVKPLSSAALDALRHAHSPLIDALLKPSAPSTSSATQPPSPDSISSPAQFADRLTALVRSSGRSLVEITQHALRHDIAITTVPLRHTLARRELPSANVLRAITVGCNLPSAQQEAWEAVRKRLATQPLSAHRLPAAPIRPAPRS